MNKILLAGLLLLNINFIVAQTIDLTSVDEFFKITSTLKEGKEISEEQWNNFDSSRCYSAFAERENKFVINTIKSSIYIVFSERYETERDSILSALKAETFDNNELLLKKLILSNYIDVKDNYNSIQAFRTHYDFNAMVEKSKLRLSSFLDIPSDSVFRLKPVYFLFISADGKAGGDALYIDFNLIFKQTEEQRINLLAHEFFHNYREKYENHDFNYKSDLNALLDGIQNEGIADLINKSEGYNKYFSSIGELPEMVEIWDSLYNQAQSDLERLHDLVVIYSKGEITENEMVDEMQEIVKFNGHPIGFFMSNQIIKAGYRKEMIETFYNPYEFYRLYNLAATENNTFQLSDGFMDYLKLITIKYYR